MQSGSFFVKIFIDEILLLLVVCSAGEYTCPETATTKNYGGYVYRTLTGLKREDPNGKCENIAATIPPGYEVPYYDADIVANVVQPYGWGVNLMQFADTGTFKVYHTKNFGSDQTFSGSLYEMVVSGNTYRTQHCTWAIM